MPNEKVKTTNTMNLWWFLAATIESKFTKDPLSFFDMPSDKGSIITEIAGQKYKISVEKV